MLISVFPPSRRNPQEVKTTFALQQDNWNDFGFLTSYLLYYNRQDKEKLELSLIGAVKVLKRGQTEADELQITSGFNQLGKEFCSVGANLDYYERLNALPINDKKQILNALNDVIAFPELEEKFSQEEGWRTSIFRDFPKEAIPEYLADARAIHTGNFEALAGSKEDFSFFIGEERTELKLDFSGPQSGPFVGYIRQDLLPHRMMVLIGRNGSGKSTLLSRIAHVAFASTLERKTPEMAKLGSFMPEGIGFTKIVAISYSAFDSFSVPGTYEDELRQMASDIEMGQGRYVYCGLRDIAAEARKDVRSSQKEGADEAERKRVSRPERRKTTQLKPIEKLGKEFADLIHRILDKGLENLFSDALKPLLSESSFLELNESGIDSLLKKPRNTFMAWSTGHKIALHVVASLVANTVRKSLVLFDEPETHLHPPLVAALMRSIRIVLEKTDAMCLVATHSPVVLQETMAIHVRRIKRTGDHIEIASPQLETFGENVGTLTYDTFGLTGASTDFHRVLDNLTSYYRKIEQIDKLFTPGLSAQARAYVMSAFAYQAEEDEEG